MDGKTVTFGEFEFDFDEMVLRSEGDPIPLQPQPSRILAILLERPGRLVTRDELKSVVWGDRLVEFDAGLNFSINQIRRALGDTAADPEYVATVHRRGYRFIAPVMSSAGDSRRRSMAPISRSGPWVVAAALIAGAAIGIRASSSARGDSLADLPSRVRTTYRAARWLWEHGQAERALARLDSVRLAAPAYAPAWVMTSHARLAGSDLVGARAAAERAIDLNPSLAEARYALGRAAFFESRGHDALLAFAEASRLEPDRIEYRQWYAQALANQLRLNEAIAQLEEARRIDPLSNLIGVDLATVYLTAGRFDDAVSYCGVGLDLMEEAERWARDCLLTAHHFRGEDELAVQQACALMTLLGATPSEVASIRSLEDYFRWDLARIDRLTAAGEPPSPYERVRSTARLEERGETLDGLRSLGRIRHYSLQWAPREVWFRFLHGDDEFRAILREAGLPVPGAPM